ncbi:MAG: hypothetical protein ACI4O7_13265 [Aristaeellaceae bacterium]
MMTLTIQFTERKATDLEQLNAMLAGLKLESLELENTSNYLSTTRNREGVVIAQRFGLDNCTLKCEPAEDEEGLQYQLDTFVAPVDPHHQRMVQRWRDSHPDREVRIVQVTEYDDAQGFLIVHHQKV